MTDINTDRVYKITQHKDAWAGIPKLAERLGVKEGENTGEIDTVLADDRKYSVYALINALLDRLDKIP